MAWDARNSGEERRADETWDSYNQDDEFSETPTPVKRWWAKGGLGPLDDPGMDGDDVAPPKWTRDKDLELASLNRGRNNPITSTDVFDLPPRADVLAEAQRLITGDRNNSYGPPTQDFRRTAEALSAMGYRRLDAEGNELPLAPSDVAIMIAMVKISRLMHSRNKRDNWADLAGYAGCGYECSTEE